MYVGSYLDLAFCLSDAAGAGFETGSGAVEGLADSYRLRHLPQNNRHLKQDNDAHKNSIQTVHKIEYSQLSDFLYKGFDRSDHPPYPYLSPTHGSVL